MKKLCAIGLAALFATCSPFAEEAAAQIRLSVDPFVTVPKLVAAPQDGRWPLLVGARLYVENCGSVPITIPTHFPPDGRPSVVSQTGDPENGNRGVWYAATLDKREGKAVQPSPQAFEPVTLQPGEQALVAVWRADDPIFKPLPGEFHDVTFGFRVSKELADKFGWWAGEVEQQVDFFERKKRSNQSSEPTAASGGGSP